MASTEVAVDAKTCGMLRAVAQATTDLGVNWLVAGASARQLLLEGKYGLAPARGTDDLDLGIMVDSWERYQTLVDDLCVHHGFREDERQGQRLISSDGGRLDLVPFGAIESSEGTIDWPPDGAVRMTTLGFSEAFAVAEFVRVDGLDVAVASPAGLLALKLIAWHERHTQEPRKDAEDIAYLLRNYERIVTTAVLWDEHAGTVERWDCDLELAACDLLGQRLAALTGHESAAFIEDQVFQPVIAEGIDTLLVDELARSRAGCGVSAERAHQLITALRSGWQVIRS